MQRFNLLFNLQLITIVAEFIITYCACCAICYTICYNKSSKSLIYQHFSNKKYLETCCETCLDKQKISQVVLKNVSKKHSKNVS